MKVRYVYLEGPQLRISIADAELAFDLARRIERGEFIRAVAYRKLTAEHGFEPHTANAYLNAYRSVRHGRSWKATIGEAAVRSLLELASNNGASQLYLALQAVQGHIAYQSGRGTATPGLVRLRNEYRARLASVADIAFGQDDLMQQVARALEDDPVKRMERLSLAPRKPAWRVRVVRDFTRNPDVIAEVLLRAQGVCECCKMLAPFLRRSTGALYLEVHHVIRLADDGDDTVENAIALCPNCHRSKHYGE